MSLLRSLAAAAVTALVAALVGLAGYALFVAFPALRPGLALVRLLGVVLALATTVAGVRLGAALAGSWFADVDVAEVAVEGPITRDGTPRSLPGGPVRPGADDVVDAVDRAADAGADALLVRLNTPGGEVVPSDDIRLAAERFDGPTVAYATDTCASGGYWIAAGCDERWAREGSVVGSIGVRGSRVNAEELADRLGLSYERLAAGEYKDAGATLKKFTEDDREYLQGLVDDYYEQFLDRVVAGTDLDRETVRETEARVYLGREAAEIGLVDELGTREDVEAALGERLGVADPSVREFRPRQGLRQRLRRDAAAVAYALGAGVAAAVGVDGDGEFEFRV